MRWSTALQLGTLLALLMALPTVGQCKKLILLYDPDANHQAIINIVVEVNAYLHATDPDLEFQPLTNRKDFERLAATPEARFAIISANVLRAGAARLHPLLVPSTDGAVFYHKLLLAKKADLTTLRGKKVAVAIENSAESTNEVIKLITEAGMPADGAYIITVSKDLDAVMALAFGQVDAALVTGTSVEAIRTVNPAAVASFKTVAQTKKVLRSPLCAFAGRTGAEEQEKLTRAWLQMADDERGRRAMHTMAIDRWVRFEPAMLER